LSFLGQVEKQELFSVGVVGVAQVKPEFVSIYHYMQRLQELAEASIFIIYN
jgi:hypothetical protein